jgi:Xaa-Pro aminopeptidase
VSPARIISLIDVLLTVIQVPIQTSLVDWSLLSKAEIKWLNEHNKAVQEILLPLLQEERDKEARDWLKRTCKSKKVWPWMGK